MSSHHIVREKQEPALLILEINGFADELLGQLLEWSPTVITTPVVFDHLNSLEIKVDIVITDRAEIGLQSDVKLIHASHDPLIAALSFLITNDYKAVNILNDRIFAPDDPFLNDLTTYAGKINMVIYNQTEKIYLARPGFSKWKPAGENIRVVSQTAGLYYEGLAMKDQFNYTTTSDGFFTLRFNEPYIFIAEDI